MKAARTAILLIIAFSILGVSVAFASEGGHSESPWTPYMLLWRVINTIALIALLVYFLKKPLVTFFAERREQIQRDLEEAREQRERAEALLREYEQKLAGMEQELERMRADLARAAEAESEKFLANAERMSAAMVESARITAEQEVRKAKVALKNEAVDLAMELAEALIREKISEQDRARIVEEYLAKVGGMK